MKTYTAKRQDARKRTWYVIDAEGVVLGRLATRIATILQGKHKADYTPHADTGDCVVVTNIEKIRVTGRKMQNKMYKRYSGYPGGQKEEPLVDVMKKQPQLVIRHAVRGMLPANRLRRGRLRRLKLYVGPEHAHTAQNPVTLER